MSASSSRGGRVSPARGIVAGLLLAAALAVVGHGHALGRAGEEAYLRIVSEQFGVPEDEVRALIRAGSRAEELPVLLRLSRYSGIAPTVLLTLHRRGSSWMGVAERYQLGAGTFHIAIPEDQVDDRVRRVHQLFRDTPEPRWNTLSLTDEEVVVLANVHLLTRGTGSTPGRVLEARTRAGSFTGSVRFLVVR